VIFLLFNDYPIAGLDCGRLRPFRSPQTRTRQARRLGPRRGVPQALRNGDATTPLAITDVVDKGKPLVRLVPG
jgi:hypothetical protein